MKGSVLIHTRTLRCDFSSDFLVRPESFTSGDIQWARKYVLQATGRIDELRGFRWLVADNNDYRLVGVVGFLEDIAKSCKSLTDDEIAKSRKLVVDEKDRRVYAFIGMVVRGIDRRCSVSTEKLWREYIRCVFPVWERSYLEPIFTEPEDIDLTNSIRAFELPKGKRWGQKLLYETNRIEDQNLFTFYASSSDSNFSFCSNLKGVADIKKSPFTIVTATSNDITRLLSEKSASTQSGSTQPQTGSFPQSSHSSEGSAQSGASTDNQKKKRFHHWASCLMIFIIVILILIFWAHKAKAASLSSSMLTQYPRQAQEEP